MPRLFNVTGVGIGDMNRTVKPAFRIPPIQNVMTFGRAAVTGPILRPHRISARCHAKCVKNGAPVEDQQDVFGFEDKEPVSLEAGRKLNRGIGVVSVYNRCCGNDCQPLPHYPAFDRAQHETTPGFRIVPQPGLGNPDVGPSILASTKHFCLATLKTMNTQAQFRQTSGSGD